MGTWVFYLPRQVSFIKKKKKLLRLHFWTIHLHYRNLVMVIISEIYSEFQKGFESDSS